jgi:hypothetical protein
MATASRAISTLTAAISLICILNRRSSGSNNRKCSREEPIIRLFLSAPALAKARFPSLPSEVAQTDHVKALLIPPPTLKAATQQDPNGGRSKVIFKMNLLPRITWNSMISRLLLSLTEDMGLYLFFFL